jgi:hypothetical protein
MNKTIDRRNPHMHVTPHCRRNRKQARDETLQKWWNKVGSDDYRCAFKMWSREDKKAFLNPGDAYTKWKRRYAKHEKTDPNMPLIVGRHVLVPADACLSGDRKLRLSLVKANAQGRRRKF